LTQARQRCRSFVARILASIPLGLLSKKILPRRANHRHIFIIATILKPAPETVAGFFESGGGCPRITFVPPQSCSPVHRGASKGIAMKRLLVTAVIAGSFFSVEANGQDRAGSAALGAVSGAVVLGPVGAVAGALIGYTAGPAIAHSWGVGHSASRSHTRRTTQASAGSEQQAAARVTPLPVAKTPEIVAARTAPPVQGFE
jgi:hypothetical protein